MNRSSFHHADTFPIPLDTPIERRIIPAVQSITTPRWRNWQTHCFEVAASNIVQVQILSWASPRPPFGNTNPRAGGHFISDPRDGN